MFPKNVSSPTSNIVLIVLFILDCVIAVRALRMVACSMTCRSSSSTRLAIARQMKMVPEQLLRFSFSHFVLNDG